MHSSTTNGCKFGFATIMSNFYGPLTIKSDVFLKMVSNKLVLVPI